MQIVFMSVACRFTIKKNSCSNNSIDIDESNDMHQERYVWNVIIIVLAKYFKSNVNRIRNLT